MNDDEFIKGMCLSVRGVLEANLSRELPLLVFAGGKQIDQYFGKLGLPIMTYSFLEKFIYSFCRVSCRFTLSWMVSLGFIQGFIWVAFKASLGFYLGFLQGFI